MTGSTETDSPAFIASFNRWRIAITSLTIPSTLSSASPSSSTHRNALRCEGEQKWEDGKIMQPLLEAKEGGEMSEADKLQELKECKRCNKWRDEAIRESPIVRFMLSHTALLPPTSSNAPITPSNLPVPITCRPCPPSMAGGYSPTLGILLCQNRFMSGKHVEDALTHELVHVWDGRRFESRGGGEWGSDLRSHACTEIRAENLSGDCRWGRELTRRNFNFSKQHQLCVRRRAILSVAANPNCASREEAEKAVNEVWESCINDTRPFDEIY